MYLWLWWEIWGSGLTDNLGCAWIGAWHGGWVHGSVLGVHMHHAACPSTQTPKFHTTTGTHMILLLVDNFSLIYLLYPFHRTLKIF